MCRSWQNGLFWRKGGVVAPRGAGARHPLSQAGRDSRATMNNNKNALAMILIIDCDIARAEQLKSMIEFLDAPAVRIAAADDWQSIAKSAGLTAVFIGNGFDADAAQRIAGDVQQAHPEVPLVMVDAEDG